VLRIWDVYPGSRNRIKEFKHFNPKFASKLSESGLFIPDPDFYPSRIPDPGVKKTPGPNNHYFVYLVNMKK
jgi:hypothetical protein